MSTDSEHPDGDELTASDITARSTEHDTVELIDPDTARKELLVCLDCGKATGLSTRRTRNVERTVERLDDRDCTAYELPEEASVGEHSVAVSIEPKRKERLAVCTECGRRTTVGAGTHELDALGAKPCQDEFTENELIGALKHNLSYQADYDAIGIGSWGCGTGNGWGRNIDSTLSHNSLPIAIITNKHRSGSYTVSVQSGKGRHTQTYERFEADDDAELDAQLLELLPVLRLLNDADDGLLNDIEERANEINETRRDAWITEAYETARATFDTKFSDTSASDLNEAFKDADGPVDDEEVLRRLFGPNARFKDVSERDFAKEVLGEDSRPGFVSMFDLLQRSADDTDQTYTPNQTIPDMGTSLDADTVFAFGPAADAITDLETEDDEDDADTDE